MLPKDDRSPETFVIPRVKLVERMKRPLRHYLYPIYKYIVNGWLSRKYQSDCQFAVDQWLWGQRGNDLDTHRRQINRLFPLKGKDVLIAGCGTGRDIISWFPYRLGSLIGIDYFNYKTAWEGLRKYTAEKCPGTALHFYQSDLSRLVGVEDETVDIVGSDAVFEHLRDLPAVLREFHRVLRPQGLVYATFGPLWHSWGGDHISGYDGLHNGYNHLILNPNVYTEYLEQAGDYVHSEHDGRTWIKHGLFSYLKPREYLEALVKAGFERRVVGVILEPRAVRCLAENPVLGAQLLDEHNELDLVITGMTIIYEKPVMTS